MATSLPASWLRGTIAYARCSSNLRRCIFSRHFVSSSRSMSAGVGLKAPMKCAPAATQSKGKATAAAAAAGASSEFPRPTSVAYDQRLANTIHLIGLVSVNPDIQYLDSGKIVATSCMTVKKSTQSDPAWFFLEFQTDLAEVAAQHVRKGDRIHVAGRVVVDTIENDTKPVVKVEVTELHFVDDTYGAKASPPKATITPQLVVQTGTYAKSGSREEKKQASVKSWNAFFASPSDWYDNRTDKRNPKAPDFKHKSTGDALWIVGFYNPENVEAKIAELEAKGLLKKVDPAEPSATSSSAPSKDGSYQPF